jgi:hypothetical protein
LLTILKNHWAPILAGATTAGIVNAFGHQQTYELWHKAMRSKLYTQFCLARVGGYPVSTQYFVTLLTSPLTVDKRRFR